MSVYDSSRPFRLRADDAFDQLVVTVPKALLQPHADRIAHHRRASAIALDTPTRRLIAAVVHELVGRVRA